MELGLHLGARLLGEGRHRKKRALILDAELHRYDAVLSDISGQDIGAHHNRPEEAIRCVRNWLSGHRRHNSPPLPGAEAMGDDYRAFKAEIPATLRRLQFPKLARLPYDDFLFVVHDWIVARARVASGG